jgi:hypothetical protein
VNPDVPQRRVSNCFLAKRARDLALPNPADSTESAGEGIRSSLQLSVKRVSNEGVRNPQKQPILTDFTLRFKADVKKVPNGRL